MTICDLCKKKGQTKEATHEVSVKLEVSTLDDVDWTNKTSADARQVGGHDEMHVCARCLHELTDNRALINLLHARWVEEK